jgi:hypothetical protein
MEVVSDMAGEEKEGTRVRGAVGTAGARISKKSGRKANDLTCGGHSAAVGGGGSERWADTAEQAQTHLFFLFPAFLQAVEWIRVGGVVVAGVEHVCRLFIVHLCTSRPETTRFQQLLRAPPPTAHHHHHAPTRRTHHEHSLSLGDAGRASETTASQTYLSAPVAGVGARGGGKRRSGK